MSAPLLEVKNLRVEFNARRGTLVAIDDVSFDIAPGEVLGVVGESGAGKSITGTAIIGLLEPPGRVAGGQILLEGSRIDNLPAEQMRKIRGRRIGAIFQDPLTSLNPLYTIGAQIVETIQTHLPMNAAQARARAIELLGEVGIPAPERRIDHFPHQFSGGMRQRVVIALALCANPRLIIADEPTTALDVSIQAQIITLLKRLCREHGTAVMLITHDMGVIADGPHRGDRAGARSHPQPAASLHRGADGIDSRGGPGPGAPAADRGLDAAAERDPAGLRVQPALPASLRPLQGGAPGPAARRQVVRRLLAARTRGGLAEGRERLERGSGACLIRLSR